MSICPHKHTKYQPTDEEWRCPKCGATDKEGFIIYESVNDMDNIECELLHPEDYLHCEKCGLDTSGKAFAAFVVKKNSLTTCPTCKGKGMVNRDFTAAHVAEVERLQHNNAQLVKTLDIREAALRDLLDAMRSTDPIQAANCRVLEYHQLKKEVANMKADRDNSKSDNDDGIAVWDLDKTMWESIKKSASESNWIPEEYLMNDWVSDVCGWLRDHPEDEVERLTAERDAAIVRAKAAEFTAHTFSVACDAHKRRAEQAEEALEKIQSNLRTKLLCHQAENHMQVFLTGLADYADAVLSSPPDDASKMGGDE